MKFLVDAQLPRRLAIWLSTTGFDAVHTLDLPHGNETSDTIINDISVSERRVVITKDADFVDSFLLHGKPYNLLLVSTGNISNAELEALFQANIEKLRKAYDAGAKFIELTRRAIIVHS